MKGIYFQPEEIQATVERRKTVTRRMIKPQPDKRCDKAIYDPAIGWRFQYSFNTHSRYHVGETAYIKEAYKLWRPGGSWNVRYKDGSIKRTDVAGDPQMDDEFLVEPTKWSNARTMPAWAARHFILIEAVGAERLQEITLEGIKAEGILPTYHHRNAHSRNGSNIPSSEFLNHYSPFVELWDSINPKYPWENNDWVWVYNFSLAKTRG